jgi:polyisoprenoid-binding protein YceI
MISRLSLLSLALLMSILSNAKAEDHLGHWRSEFDHSKLQFIALFEGAEAAGQFDVFDVKMAFDPEDLNGSGLNVTIQISSANMGNSDMNSAITETQWFDLGRFPIATFSSRRIQTLGENKFMAEGILKLKGKEKIVNFPFQWVRVNQHAELTGALTLSRIDFDIGMGEWSENTPIGHAIQVKFDIRMIPVVEH